MQIAPSITIYCSPGGRSAGPLPGPAPRAGMRIIQEMKKRDTQTDIRIVCNNCGSQFRLCQAKDHSQCQAQCVFTTACYCYEGWDRLTLVLLLPLQLLLLYQRKPIRWGPNSWRPGRVGSLSNIHLLSAEVPVLQQNVRVEFSKHIKRRGWPCARQA